jgi:hypothetical protein
VLLSLGEVVKEEFLEKYFPADVRSQKEIEFLELKQRNMYVVDCDASLRSFIAFSRITMLWELRCLNV